MDFINPMTIAITSGVPTFLIITMLFYQQDRGVLDQYL